MRCTERLPAGDHHRDLAKPPHPGSVAGPHEPEKKKMSAACLVRFGQKDLGSREPGLVQDPFGSLSHPADQISASGPLALPWLTRTDATRAAWMCSCELPTPILKPPIYQKCTKQLQESQSRKRKDEDWGTGRAEMHSEVNTEKEEWDSRSFQMTRGKQNDETGA